MDATANELGKFHALIWDEISSLDTPRQGFAGLATLATIGDDGPQIRQLVLRQVDRTNARAAFYTDSATPKCSEISGDNRVSALIWSDHRQLQIRLSGTAQVVPLDADSRIWQTMHRQAQENYGVMPVPGTPIARAHAYVRIPNADRLAVLELSINHIDAVRLGDRPHIRACFRRADNWAGQWLAP